MTQKCLILSILHHAGAPAPNEQIPRKGLTSAIVDERLKEGYNLTQVIDCGFWKEGRIFKKVVGRELIVVLVQQQTETKQP